MKKDLFDLIKKTTGFFKKLFKGASGMCWDRSRSIFQAKEGFALIEIMIALVIFGIIIGQGSLFLLHYHKMACQNKTRRHQEQIIDALAQFLAFRGSLPIPLDPSCLGTPEQNNARGGKHMVQIGLVPYGLLGLGEEVAKDGYGRWMTYVVNGRWIQTWARGHTLIQMRVKPQDTNYVDIQEGDCESLHRFLYNQEELFEANRLYPDQAHKSSFTSGPYKGMVVAPEEYRNQIVFALISHGEDGGGAFTSQGGKIPVAPEAGKCKIQNASLSTVNGAVMICAKPPHMERDFQDRVVWVCAYELLQKANISYTHSLWQPQDTVSKPLVYPGYKPTVGRKRVTIPEASVGAGLEIGSHQPPAME